MAVTLSQINTASDSFGNWITKTNSAIAALTSVVTVGGTAPTGNAEIIGDFKSVSVTTDTIKPAGNTIALTSNTVFGGANVSFGPVTTVHFTGGNTTSKFLGVTPGTGKGTFFNLLTEIVAIDGTGSGIDSDLLDGQHGAYYLAFPNMTGNVSATQHGTQTTGTLHSAANSTNNGFMSSSDKTKLDGVATGANNYAHPTGDGNLHVPVTSTTNDGRFLMAGNTAGAMSWVSLAISNITGLQSALDVKSPLASPAFTGTPTAPTATPGTNTQQLSTTAFVTQAVSTKANIAHTHEIGEVNNLTATLNGKLSTGGGVLTGFLEIQSPAPRLQLHYPSIRIWYFDITSDGSLRTVDSTGGVYGWSMNTAGQMSVRAYGWLHEYFATKAELNAGINDRVYRVGYGDYGENSAVLGGWSKVPNGKFQTGLLQAANSTITKLSSMRVYQYVPSMGGWQWSTAV